MAKLKKDFDPNEESEASEAHSGDPENTRGNVRARLRRTQTPPVRTGEVHFRKFPRNSDGQRPTRQVEHNSRAAKGTPGRIHGATTEFDVIVPPFDGWDERNPTPGENYTEIFGKVVHARRTLDGSYKLSQTETRGCGCFSWIC